MNNKGFSLIEMLVVVLIFTIVMGAAIGVFTTALKLQKYNLAYQQLLSQVSYAMEYMDRSIRMAVKDDGTHSCLSAGDNYNNSPGSSSSITFLDYRDRCQTFYLNLNRVRSTNTGISGNAVLDLTSSDFTVTVLRFVISGDIAGSQPKVTIVMEIQANTTVLPKPKIKIQTTVSQRNLNL
jgi:prepilin-type N-terminal cleavage/methylation domain-containing protein